MALPFSTLPLPCCLITCPFVQDSWVGEVSVFDSDSTLVIFCSHARPTRGAASPDNRDQGVDKEDFLDSHVTHLTSPGLAPPPYSTVYTCRCLTSWIVVTMRDRLGRIDYASQFKSCRWASSCLQAGCCQWTASPDLQLGPRGAGDMKTVFTAVVFYNLSIIKTIAEVWVNFSLVSSLVSCCCFLSPFFHHTWR